MDEFLGIRISEISCSSSIYYRSVISFGESRVISNFDEKKEILTKILKKYVKKLSYIDLKRRCGADECYRTCDKSDDWNGAASKNDRS